MKQRKARLLMTTLPICITVWIWGWIILYEFAEPLMRISFWVGTLFAYHILYVSISAMIYTRIAGDTGW